MKRLGACEVLTNDEKEEDDYDDAAYVIAEKKRKSAEVVVSLFHQPSFFVRPLAANPPPPVTMSICAAHKHSLRKFMDWTDRSPLHAQTLMFVGASSATEALTAFFALYERLWRRRSLSLPTEPATTNVRCPQPVTCDTIVGEVDKGVWVNWPKFQPANIETFITAFLATLNREWCGLRLERYLRDSTAISRLFPSALVSIVDSYLTQEWEMKIETSLGTRTHIHTHDCHSSCNLQSVDSHPLRTVAYCCYTEFYKNSEDRISLDAMILAVYNDIIPKFARLSLQLSISERTLLAKAIILLMWGSIAPPLHTPVLSRFPFSPWGGRISPTTYPMTLAFCISLVPTVSNLWMAGDLERLELKRAVGTAVAAAFGNRQNDLSR
jgi:hypothetical protein